MSRPSLPAMSLVIVAALGCGGGGGGGGAGGSGSKSTSDLPLLSIRDVQVKERDSGKAEARMEVRLSKALKKAVRVSFSVVEGTARAGKDFEAKEGVLELPAGETSVAIALGVLGDELDEADETMAVVLSRPKNAALGKDRATATILDDDPAPELTVRGGTAIETAQGGTAAFAVELSAVSGQAVEVAFVTRDGDAKGGSDFERASGTLRFEPGELSSEVIVKLLHDGRAEADESFSLELEKPRHATIDAERARSTILDLSDAPGGLDERPEDPCTIDEPAPADPAPGLIPAFPALWQSSSIQEAVGLVQAPGDDSRWFVVSRPGRVLVFRNDPAVSSSSVALDIRERVTTESEGGFLGMAFHPDFASNGYAFLCYTTPGNPMTTVISRFRSRDRGATFRVDSEELILRLENRNVFHKGGHLAFGPDGYLYAGLGDDGFAENSQDLNVLPGKVLRLDIDGGSPYAIPPDNPFASGGGRPEVYAWGFRNPWRWSFDRATGDLWLGDVGEESWEEIDRIEKGGNYGWPYREGTHCYRPGVCDTAGLTDPVVEWPHAGGGNAAVGGFVYRGKALPELAGAFLYGDWGARRIYAFGPGDDAPRLLAQLDVGTPIFSFAEDIGGEIHVITGGRRIFLLGSHSQAPADLLPTRLSDLACVSADDPSRPGPGFIPYDVNVPFWSDGATKERWVSIPAGQTIRIDSRGDWELPVGSVLIKHFRLGGKLIETRVLVHRPESGWSGFTYEWQDSQRDATLLTGGKTKRIGGQTWIFPSRSQCLDCHTDAAGGTLGLETLQMNRDVTYPTRRTRNQIATLARIGLFASSPGDPQRLPALPRLSDEQTPIAERARAYLHVNCSHCHRPESLGRGSADLRFNVPEKAMGICDAAPLTADPDDQKARVLLPGDPQESVLFRLMNDGGDRRMPPLATNRVDREGAELIEAWIESLPGCP